MLRFLPILTLFLSVTGTVNATIKPFEFSCNLQKPERGKFCKCVNLKIQFNVINFYCNDVVLNSYWRFLFSLYYDFAINHIFSRIFSPLNFRSQYYILFTNLVNIFHDSNSFLFHLMLLVQIIKEKFQNWSKK